MAKSGKRGVRSLLMGATGLALGLWGAVGSASAAAPRTPWVAEPREIVNLCSDTEWKIATTKRKDTKEFLRMAGAAKITRKEIEPLNEATAKWCSIKVPGRNVYGGVGWYQRTFTLTPAQAAKSVLLNFEYVGSQFKVWLNGHLAADVPQTSTFRETVDLTPFVKAGENTLRVMTAGGWGDDDSWCDWVLNYSGVEWLQGIIRPVYLELRDRVAVERVVVRTALAPRKEMTLLISVTNGTDRAFSGEVVAGGKGDVSEPPAFAATVSLAPGEGKTVSVTRPWDAAELWSPANPKLYRITASLNAGGRTLDRYKVRFGYREITWKGTKHGLLLNGKPFMMLRSTCNNFGDTKEEMVEMFRRLQKRGYVGARIFTGECITLDHIADAADEHGFLITTSASSGWGAGLKTDVFWPRWKRMLQKMLDGNMEHPSIICWGLSNEFGTVYGGNGPDGKKNMANAVKQGETGEWVQAYDPTRPWVCHGEVELRWGEEGPMPIRSYHYPVPAYLLPHAGRWYANGQHGWQGVFTNEKPVCVSEDIFHGFQETQTAVLKAKAGDRAYRFDGYVEAMRYCLRSYAEGYYLGGLAGWNPWCFREQEKLDRIYDGFEFSANPVYLLMLKEFPRNVTAGEPATRTLVAFNHWFAPAGTTLTRTVCVGGKMVSRETQPLHLDAGGRHEQKVTFTAPTVDRITPFEYVCTWTDKGGTRLAEEKFEFVAVPPLPVSAISPAAGFAAVVTLTNSPLRTVRFPKGVHAGAAAALAKKPRFVAVHGHLPAADAQLLDDWVKTGGRVLQLEPGKDDWCLARPSAKGAHHAFLFRRDDNRMTDIPEQAMRLWAPDGIVGSRPFQKPLAVDSRVLWDMALGDGMNWTDAAWIWRGKGGWLISTVPALERLGVEPVAAHFVRSLLDEVATPKPRVPFRRTALVDFGGRSGTNQTTAAALLARYNATVETVRPPKNPRSIDAKRTVYLVDAKGTNLTAAAKAFVKAVYRRNGVAVVLDMAKETDPEWLAFLGINWEKLLPTKMVPIPWNPKAPDRTPMDQSRQFFTRESNAGVMAGISNYDLFWWDDTKMWRYWNWDIFENYPQLMMNGEAGEPASAYFEPADSHTRVLTRPGAIGIRHEKGAGTVVFCSFGIGKKGYGGNHGDKVYRVIRTIVNNLGGVTSKVASPAKFDFVDISPLANRGSVWGDRTGYDLGSGDFRYFPVNREGWSPAVGNYCPKEPFPHIPLCYNNVYFRLVDPDANGGKSMLLDRGQGNVRYAVKFPEARKVKRLHFLGFEMWKPDAALVTFGGQEKGVEMKPGVHYAHMRGHHTSLKEGKLAWSGKWDLPAEKLEAANVKPGSVPNVHVWQWAIDNPDPKKPIDSFTISNASGLGIIAITIEE